LLNFLLKWSICSEARIGYSIFFGCSKIRLGPGSRIGHFNVFSHVASISLATNVRVGRLNRFHSGETNRTDLKRELVLAAGVTITSRHFFDCSGSVYVGKNTTIGGMGSRFWTHQVSIRDDGLQMKEIHIENIA